MNAPTKLMTIKGRSCGSAEVYLSYAAEENGITVLSSKHSVFELCAAIWEAARTGA